MSAERWKTALFGAEQDGLETGTAVIARAGDPGHKSQ